MASHGLVRWQCDICHREIETENISSVLGERAIQPDGWFTIQWQTREDKDVIHHDLLLCSLICLEMVSDNFRER